MSRAIGAVVAHDSIAGVAGVGVGFQGAFGDLDGVFGDDLVQGVGAAAEGFARVAVAEDMGFVVEGDVPFDLAAVALCVVGRHCEIGCSDGDLGCDWWVCK